MTQRNYLKEMQEHYAQVMSSESGEKKKVAMTFCPSTWNLPCKLCDHCKEILFHQDKHTAEKIEQAREINRKPKFYANVVLPTNPAEVLLFEYGKTIGDKLGIYEMDNNSDLKGFTNPKTGRNMVIVRYPNPDKRKTRYDVEPRMATSALIDMSILDSLFNLDDVPNLLAGGVQPLYQSKLTNQRTELRWLPFWDWKSHPELISVFQVKYFIHYHISPDELEAINRGEFNPLEDVPTAPPRTISIPSTPTTPTPSTPPPIAGVTKPNTSVWDEIPTTAGIWTADIVQPLEVKDTKGAKPGCFGTYDEDPICIKRCDEKGWLESCKLETKAQFDKRRQARNLSYK